MSAYPKSISDVYGWANGNGLEMKSFWNDKRDFSILEKIKSFLFREKSKICHFHKIQDKKAMI